MNVLTFVGATILNILFPSGKDQTAWDILGRPDLLIESIPDECFDLREFLNIVPPQPVAPRVLKKTGIFANMKSHQLVSGHQQTGAPPGFMMLAAAIPSDSLAAVSTSSNNEEEMKLKVNCSTLDVSFEINEIRSTSICTTQRGNGVLFCLAYFVSVQLELKPGVHGAKLMKSKSTHPKAKRPIWSGTRSKSTPQNESRFHWLGVLHQREEGSLDASLLSHLLALRRVLVWYLLVCCYIAEASRRSSRRRSTNMPQFM